MLALNAEIGVGFLVRLKQNNGSSTGYKQQRTKLELGLLVESAGLLPVKTWLEQHFQVSEAFGDNSDDPG